jgi:hypothetical protein
MALATNQNAVSALLASRFSKYEVRPRASQKAAPFGLSEKPIEICLTPIVFLAHNFSACASTGALFAAAFASICGAEIGLAAIAGMAFYGLVALAERATTFWHPSYRT